MVIEILNGGEILLNCKFKLNKNLNLNLHRKILRNSNPTKIPIRLCTVRAGSCNSSVQMCTPVNATDVTAKAIFERLYLVPGRRTFALSINFLCASTPPTAHSVANSQFFCLFHPCGPSFFFQHDSPSNLDESRYPHRTPSLIVPCDVTHCNTLHHTLQHTATHCKPQMTALLP